MDDSNEKEIQSLIRLLDDTDETVVSIVTNKLLELGDSALPLMHEAEPASEPLVKKRLQRIIHEVGTGRLELQFQELAETSGDVDLEQGALLIAKFGYPALDVNRYANILNRFARNLNSRLQTKDDPEDVIPVINAYLFHEEGFRGNREDYFNPDNSFLNKVIDNRVGIPISLAVVYLLVAKRLNVPVYGIGMPAHFLLSYQVPPYHVFLDPFNAGAVLTRDQCVKFLRSAGYEFREEFLDTVSNRAILERMMRNLIAIYSQLGEETKAESLSRYIEILQTPD
jgi:regulator of sirC expression with transglutaminase-like and TPR domain